jgi:hypothetical protein
MSAFTSGQAERMAALWSTYRAQDYNPPAAPLVVDPAPLPVPIDIVSHIATCSKKRGYCKTNADCCKQKCNRKKNQCKK